MNTKKWYNKKGKWHLPCEKINKGGDIMGFNILTLMEQGMTYEEASKFMWITILIMLDIIEILVITEKVIHKFFPKLHAKLVKYKII